MSDVKPKHSPHNPKVDPVLAFLVRAQARVRLYYDGAMTLDELTALADEADDRGIMSREEALIILRLCYRRARR